MSTGEVKTVLVCVPVSGPADTFCGSADGQNYALSTTQALLIDPDMLPMFQELSEPFSPAFAGAVFGFFFSVTITVWMTAKSAGLILSAIRKF